MTRNDIARSVAKSRGLTIPDADKAVLAVFSAISESLARGEAVYIRGFGTFETAVRAARKGRVINANEVIDIPSCTVPVFRPAPGLKKLVDEK